MPNALSPPPENPECRARRETRLVLGVCALTSLLLHLMLVWLWPGYGGTGTRTARLRATISSMPATPLPVMSPTPLAPQAATPQDSVANSARRAAPVKAPGEAMPESPAQKVSADRLSEDSGGGRLSEYVPVELLSTKPRFLADLSEYIPASLEASESGRIVVQVLIGLDGEVDGVVIEHSELTPRGTRRFIQRLDALKLHPGLRDGLPVKARWRMEFNFSPQTD